MLTLTIT
jgi:vacuole morphology and inheritance protein 14